MAINSIEGKLEDNVEGRPCIQSDPFEEMFWYIHDHGVYGLIGGPWLQKR